MESYIVRVYRRGSGSLAEITGVVELPEREKRRVFHNLAELEAILMQPPAGQPEGCPPTRVGQG